MKKIFENIEYECECDTSHTCTPCALIAKIKHLKYLLDRFKVYSAHNSDLCQTARLPVGRCECGLNDLYAHIQDELKGT